MFEPSFGFQIMSTIFPIFFIIIFGIIAFAFIKGISQWSYNNKQPVLSVIATIKSKRSNTTHRTHTMNDTVSTHSSTFYYVTFEVESGDRMEFGVSGRDFGLLAEGDKGKLTFQGTRFLRFEREK